MSKKCTTTIKCHNCSTQQEVEIWESLNAQLSPEAKNQFIEGTLFQTHCSHCNETLYLDYPMLYHDMAAQVMVQYCDDEQYQTMANTYKEMKKESEKASNYDM